MIKHFRRTYLLKGGNIFSLLFLFIFFLHSGAMQVDHKFDFKKHTAYYLLNLSNRLKVSADEQERVLSDLIFSEFCLQIGNYEKADSISNLLIKQYNLSDRPEFVSYTYIIKAEALYTQGYYDQAYEAGLNAYKKSIACGETKLMALSFLQLAKVYSKLKNYTISQKFLHASSKLAKQINDLNIIAQNNFELANNFLDQHNYEDARALYQLSSDQFRVAYNNNLHSYAEMQTGVCFSQQNNSTKALEIFQHVLFTFYNNQEFRLASLCLLHLGNNYAVNGEYKKAIIQLTDCYNIAEKINEKSLMAKASGLISESYQKLGNYKEALGYNIKMQEIENNILNAKITEQINRMDAHYQNEQKKTIIQDLNRKNEILQANALLKQKQQQLMLGGLVMLLLIVLMGWRLYSQRLKNKEIQATQLKRIHEQEMQELVTSQQLKTVESILETQESERKRIATDLHDRVGSLLSTVKLYFKSVEHSIANDHPELVSRIRKSAGILDAATEEVRKISHDMESGVLAKFGLVSALKDLCDQLNETSVIRTNFNSHVEDIRLPEKTEAGLYRCAQEIITNTIKHSEATELNVELTQFDHSLNLIIADNGKGFEADKFSENNSLGLKNIQNRVALMRGKLSIDSNNKSGTTIIIELSV